MRRILISLGFILLSGGPSWSADFTAPQIPELYDWTGLYIGATGGWGFDGTLEAEPKDFPFLKTREDNFNGGMAGGMIGWRWQVNQTPVVLGIEGQGLWADVKGDDTIPVIGPLVIPTKGSIDALASARAQVGIAYDHALVYLSGGWAGADASLDARLKLIGDGSEKIFSDQRFVSGVVVGAGIDLALGDAMGGNWVLGLALDHYSFDTVNFSDHFPGEDWSVKTDSNINFNTVTGRLSFHF